MNFSKIFDSIRVKSFLNGPWALRCRNENFFKPRFFIICFIWINQILTLNFNQIFFQLLRNSAKAVIFDLHQNTFHWKLISVRAHFWRFGYYGTQRSDRMVRKRSYSRIRFRSIKSSFFRTTLRDAHSRYPLTLFYMRQGFHVTRFYEISTKFGQIWREKWKKDIGRSKSKNRLDFLDFCLFFDFGRINTVPQNHLRAFFILDYHFRCLIWD